MNNETADSLLDTRNGPESEDVDATDFLAELLAEREASEKVRVEWAEDELRLMGEVKPGSPSKLNTFGTPKVYSSQPAALKRPRNHNWVLNLAGHSLSLTALAGIDIRPRH